MVYEALTVASNDGAAPCAAFLSQDDAPSHGRHA